MGRLTREAKVAKREARKVTRAGRRKIAVVKTKKAVADLRYVMSKAGVGQTMMSDLSGVDPSALISIRRRQNNGIRLSTYIAVANACGYDVKLVKKAAGDDEFRAFRRVLLTDIDNGII